MAAVASSRRPLPVLLHATNLSGARLLASSSSSSSALRASSAGSFPPPCIWTLRPGQHQPPHLHATIDSRRASGPTSNDTPHNRAGSTLQARAVVLVGGGSRRWQSSVAGVGDGEAAALRVLSKAIEAGDETAVRQLASSLSKKAAARLVEELSQQNKVNVVAGENSKVVRVEDFVNIDRNADGVITSQEFERFIRESEHNKVTEPTRQQLWMVGLASSVPFVGFGFMDNAIMILAGEMIEAELGVAFGITTMAAAAIGNLISDVAGVGLGGTVEVIAAKFGCKQPALSTEQMQMRSTQLCSNMGAAVGVALGCFLGMFPLLLMAHKDDEDKEKPEPAGGKA